jgi:hypothetical protein
MASDGGRPPRQPLPGPRVVAEIDHSRAARMPGNGKTQFRSWRRMVQPVPHDDCLNRVVAGVLSRPAPRNR